MSDPYMSLMIDATVVVDVDEDGQFSARILIADPLGNEWQQIYGREVQTDEENTLLDEKLVVVMRRMEDEYLLMTKGYHPERTRHERQRLHSDRHT